MATARSVEIGRGPAPLSVFSAVASRPGVFFLDSAGFQPGLSDWCFIGAEPFLTLDSTGRAVSTTSAGSTATRRASPLAELRRQLTTFRVRSGEGLPPFTGGAVGFLGYDLKHQIERLPRIVRRDHSFPDMRMGFYDRVLAWHRPTKTWHACISPVGPAAADPVGARDCCLRLLDEASCAAAEAARQTEECPSTEITPCMTRDSYLRSVARVIDYIAAGDIFQANFTQRFQCQTKKSPADLYRALRKRSPCPFAAYLDAGEGRAIMSSSPERFIKLDGGIIETRPIKGTRPRGRTRDEDAALAAELVASPKDNAELAMIVDLERNDLGRVADYGSVRVAVPRTLESHPTVHHLVAVVEGDLGPGRDAVDLIRATFPGGSITGAPKVRAMEIIEELEPTSRAVYTGAIGYIDFRGNLDLNIAIRTILYERGRLSYQVGGGIVADSDPEDEYEECLAKARAMRETIRDET